MSEKLYFVRYELGQLVMAKTKAEVENRVKENFPNAIIRSIDFKQNVVMSGGRKTI
jgi:hypothetical protein